MSFLCRVRTSDIQRGLGVEPLLLHVETSQFRWFRHLIRMPVGHLEVFWTCTTGRRPQCRSRTHWKLYVSSGLGTPRDPPGGAGIRGMSGLPCKQVNGWMDGMDELATSSPCLQSTHGCTGDYYWITLVLKKTQASSAVISCFLSAFWTFWTPETLSLGKCKYNFCQHA